MTEPGEERRLQLSKLDEIRAEAYESARSYKERVKLFHDKHILRKEFALGMKVLLYDSKLYLFPGKFLVDRSLYCVTYFSLWCS